jgi:hypothetical protein
MPAGDYIRTGRTLLTQAERVSIVGHVLGGRIGFEELSPDEFRGETQASRPRPPWTCCSMRGAQRWAGRGTSPQRCRSFSGRCRDRWASGFSITRARSLMDE